MRMKRIIALILVIAVVYVPMPSAVFAADAENEFYDIVWEYSGTAEGYDYVSAMILDADADSDNPTEKALRHIEVAEPEEDGSFSLRIPLENVRLDSNGSITNLKLKSNIEGLSLSDGILKKESSVLITDTYEENGVVFVPMVSAFGALDVTMTETSDGVFEGFGKNGQIKLEIGKDTAEVDWVELEMPAASKYVNGTAMVPAYILEDAAYTKPAVYDKASGLVKVTPIEGDGLYKSYDNSIDYETVVPTLPTGEEWITSEDFVKYLSVSTSADKVELSNEYVLVDKGLKKVKQIKTSEYNYTEPANGDIQLMKGVEHELKAGEVALVSFKARLLSAQGNSDSVTIGVQHQRYSDWAKAMVTDITIKTGDWQQFYLPVYSAYNDMPAGSPLTLSVGGKAKTIQIAEFSYVYYGTSVSPETLIPKVSTDGYKGIEDDALWRKEANRRIEKYRKGDVSVNVKDASGNPLKGVTVKAKQTESEFMFGLALMKNEIPNASRSEQDIAITEELITNSMNTLVPSDVMKPPGAHENDGADSIEMVNEILSRGKRLRGHTLMWDLNTAMWPFDNVRNISYEELYRSVMDYVLPTAYTFRGKLEQWDVLNEPIECNTIRKKYGTRLYADVSRAVHEIDPDVKLYVNETSMNGLNSAADKDVSPMIAEIVTRMKAEGAHIDGIGIQAHCGSYLYPQGFYHQLDNCAAAVDEISVTEYDFKNTDKSFEAEHLRDTLLATFSHPKAKAFVVWEYMDARHWNFSAPFYDSEWNEKPAMAVWNKMVKSDFKTNTETVSDENGSADFRGFYGDYEITAEFGGKTVTFPFKHRSDGSNVISITVGDTISYTVSAKPDAAKTPVPYSSIAEAKKEFEASRDYKYEGIVLEGDFGKTASLAEITDNGYLNGNDWASKSGAASNISVEGDGISVLSASGTSDLRHKIVGTAYKNNALSVECRFETGDIAEDETEAEISVEDRSGALTKIGRIACDKDGYCFETRSGHRIALKKNSAYNISAELKYSGGGYAVTYSIYSGGELYASYAEDGSVEAAAEEISGVIFDIASSGTSGRTAFKLRSTRIKYSTSEDIINFFDTSENEYLFSDTMRGFDFSATTFSTVSDKYKNGEAWQKSSNDVSKVFSNGTSGWKNDYLWSVRSNDGVGTQTLRKKIEPIESGKSIKAEFDLYCKAPGVWYDNCGSFGMELSATDGSAAAKVFEYYYDQYRGACFASLNQNVYEEHTGVGVYNDEKTDMNRNTLKAVLELTPNDNGNYDASLTVKNYTGKTVVDYSASDYISAADVLKLDSVKLFSRTDAGGTRYGDVVCGIKDIVISQTAVGIERGESGRISVSEGTVLEIPYVNVTGRPIEAVLAVGAYDTDGALKSVQSGNISLSDIKKGGINVKVENKDADFYKVFLMKSFEKLNPFREADTVIIEGK